MTPKQPPHDFGRPKTNPYGVPIGEFTRSDRDDTDVLKGRALEEARKKRPTDEAIAHHDHRLDTHAAKLAGLEVADARIEGKVDTGNALLIGHTAILDAQTKQLDRLLNERSAETAAKVERGTATYKTVLAWITPVVSAAVTFLVARGC